MLSKSRPGKTIACGFRENLTDISQQFVFVSRSNYYLAGLAKSPQRPIYRLQRLFRLLAPISSDISIMAIRQREYTVTAF